MIAGYISKKHWFLVIFCSAIVMLFSAGLYDWVWGSNACIICWLQRLVLVFLIFFSILGYHFGWYRGVIGASGIGLLLDIRHIYVALFPKQASACIPMDFLLQMPVGQMIKQVLKWVSELGRDCSLEVDKVTYLLIIGLLVYYSVIIYSWFRWVVKQESFSEKIIHLSTKWIK